MQNGSQRTPIASLLIGVIGTLSLAAYGQSVPLGNGTTSASESLLRRNTVVPMSVVNRFFPEVTQEASTGQNLTAVGKPKATRSVIYANSDSSIASETFAREGFRASLSAPRLVVVCSDCDQRSGPSRFVRNSF